MTVLRAPMHCADCTSLTFRRFAVDFNQHRAINLAMKGVLNDFQISVMVPWPDPFGWTGYKCSSAVWFWLLMICSVPPMGGSAAANSSGV